VAKCSKCKQTKSAEDFPKSKSSWCKSCHSLYYRQNKKRIAAQKAALHRERMDTSPEYRQRHNQLSAEWRGANPEKARAAKTAWRRKHPVAHAVHEAKRRALKASCGGDHSVWDLLLIFEAQGGACAYCAKPVVEYHVDHMTPLSRGGSNEASNLAITCPNCNLSKGTKTSDEFMMGGCHR
jgi:5-methylcytosine-specific restriction endonuclease McrA